MRKKCVCVSEKSPGTVFVTLSRELQIFNETVLSVSSFCLSQQQWTFPSEEVRGFAFFSECQIPKRNAGYARNVFFNTAVVVKILFLL